VREGSTLTDKWWRWKKRSEWDEFFKEFDKLEKMVDDMANDSAKTFPTTKAENKFSNPYVFGFSVSVGPDGRPQVHRFGSLQSPLQGAEASKEREPLVDVLNGKKEIIVVAELPGVDEKDIKLDLYEFDLRISIDTPEKSFYKNLSLPAKVRSDSMRTSYKNGVLTVHLKKAGRRLAGIKKHLALEV
jgi:HSP20 family protein